MKLSFSKWLIITSFSFIGFSCTKESGQTDAALNNSTGQGGSLSKFTVVGNFLYAVDNHYLYTYDISNPANPTRTSTSDINFDVETLYPFNNKLFIGTRTGLYIYSIDVPASPVKLGEASHARSCDPVVANDSIAFVTLKGNSFCGPAVSGLYVHDIRNVFQPVLLKTVELPNPEGLGLKGNILYICCNNDGLTVMDVSAPNNPVLIRTITGQYFKDVIPFDDILICYVTTGIMLYDISNPTNPVAVKLIQNT